jgi:hypothetical protein
MMWHQTCNNSCASFKIYKMTPSYRSPLIEIMTPINSRMTILKLHDKLRTSWNEYRALSTNPAVKDDEYFKRDKLSLISIDQTLLIREYMNDKEVALETIAVLINSLKCKTDLMIPASSVEITLTALYDVIEHPADIPIPLFEFQGEEMEGRKFMKPGNFVHKPEDRNVSVGNPQSLTRRMFRSLLEIQL